MYLFLTMSVMNIMTAARALVIIAVLFTMSGHTYLLSRYRS